jgi:hypothetical protein
MKRSTLFATLVVLAVSGFAQTPKPKQSIFPVRIAQQAVDDSGWLALTLEHGCANIGGPYTPARYRKLNGRVTIEAFVTGCALNVMGTVIATLPDGFRRDNEFPYPVMSNGASPIVGDSYASPFRADGVAMVAADGSITVFNVFGNVWWRVRIEYQAAGE